MKKKFGQNLSQIGALYDFYGQKNLDRQSSGIELTYAQSLTAVATRNQSIHIP